MLMQETPRLDQPAPNLYASDPNSCYSAEAIVQPLTTTAAWGRFDPNPCEGMKTSKRGQATGHASNVLYHRDLLSPTM
jgi:hypothetical protein